MISQVVALRPAHFVELHDAFDRVAKEKKYLAFQTAPSQEEATAFYRNILAHDYPHFVALVGEKVVGWCDVLPTYGESRAHVGILGIALVEEGRSRGLGALLMDAAILKSWEYGFTRIELTVRADNLRAIALYKSRGFALEGTNRKAFFVDGLHFDTYSMGLVRGDAI